ncbi:MAG: hypothetical protein ACYCO4_02980 [Sulfobacillus sp.]
MASVETSTDPPRAPVDLTRWWPRLLAMAAGGGVVAGLVHVLAWSVPQARPLGLAATHLWLFGGLAVWLYLTAAAVTTISHQRPMPQARPVLWLMAALAVGGLMLAATDRWPQVSWLGRLGWLIEAAVGVGGIVSVWLTDVRLPLAHGEHDELLIPGFRLGPAEAKSDRLARVMLIVGQVDLIIGSFYAIRNGDALWPVHGAFLLLWWGWAVSIATGAAVFLLPRVTGRHLVVGQALVGGFVLWQLGIWAGFFLGPVALWAATAGGLLVVGDMVRALPGAFRPRPHAVGSRRLGLAVGLRRLLVGGLVALAVAMVAMPWQGTPELAAAWGSGGITAVMLAFLVHVSSARHGQRVHGEWLLTGAALVAGGLLLVPWAPWAEAVGGTLTALGGLITLWVLGRSGWGGAEVKSVSERHGA